MELDLGKIRHLYAQAADHPAKGKELYELLAGKEKQLSGVYLAYLGAALALEAKNSLNMFSKLFSIQKANAFFAQAVKEDPEDVETRFLRFSIQINTPAFLGYSGQVTLDKKKILENIHASPVDLEMRQAIANFVLDSSQCTSKDAEQLKLFLSTKL